MDRDEALRLLRGGEEGVAEWNRLRSEDEEIPDLTGANLTKAGGALRPRAETRSFQKAFEIANGAVLQSSALTIR